MKIHKVVAGPGEEVLAKTTQYCQQHDIKDAAIVSVIGAFDSACIHAMKKNDAKKTVLTTVNEPVELSGIGEVVDGTVHIHAVLSKENGETLSGHLEWGKVESWFAHVYLAPLED